MQHHGGPERTRAGLKPATLSFVAPVTPSFHSRPTKISLACKLLANPPHRGSSIAPSDPNAAIIPNATGDTLPSGTPPPAQVQPGEAVKPDDGTITVGTQGSGPVRLTHDDALAIARAAALSNDPANQIQQEAGTAGLLFNPNVGFTPTEKIATAGGSAIGKDSAAAAADDPSQPGGYTGTGIEGQDQNTITQVLATDDSPVTPELARNYALAWGRQFGTPRIQRTEDASGNIVDI